MRSLGIDSGPIMGLEFHTGRRTLRWSTSLKELNQWKRSQSSTAIHHYRGQCRPSCSSSSTLPLRDPHLKAQMKTAVSFRVGNTNDNTEPATWSPPHRPCSMSQPATQGQQKPSETLSFRRLAGDSACRGGTPSFLVRLLPHLDCTALPHCQPIGTSSGSAHILPFATDIASCRSLLLEHAACPVPRACGEGRKAVRGR